MTTRNDIKNLMAFIGMAGYRKENNMDELIHDYCKLNGAIQVWSTWRQKMISQGREVKDKYRGWPIPDQDIELDSLIAYDVIDDFLTWIGAHYGLRLTKTENYLTKKQSLIIAHDELDDVQFIDNTYREGEDTKSEVWEIITRLADRLSIKPEPGKKNE